MDSSGHRPSTPRRFFARLYGERASTPPFTSSLLFSDWCSFQADHKPFINRTRRKEARPRRQRTTFTSDQTADLETEFQQSEYVSRAQRKSLAERLSLSETQVKIWFQNRRAKDKRIEKAFLDNQYSRNLALITTSSVSVGFSSMMQQIPCPFCYTLRQDTNVFYSPNLIKEKVHRIFTSESPCCSLETSKCSNRETMPQSYKFIT